MDSNPTGEIIIKFYDERLNPIGESRIDIKMLMELPHNKCQCSLDLGNKDQGSITLEWTKSEHQKKETSPWNTADKKNLSKMFPSVRNSEIVDHSQIGLI